ncbi:MAG TPA: ATP-binding protein [Kofleriaceae bacterium]|nr:ATP-binding protein [Kofleriaceae bacterium]
MTDSKPRVLFVEDNIGKRYVIARQLRGAGFEIDEASTGQDGLALLSPSHDVAIIDIKLPDMLGWDLCKRIKGNPETSAVKVLELSATLASAEDRARGLELGADCYLVHPIELVELVAALRALIRLRNAERDRLRAQELLIATLGHDLRNPLNVIATGLSALGDSVSMTDRERETVKRLDRTATRMNRMIEQVMVVAQTLGGEIVPVSLGPVDLGELVTQVIHDSRTTGGHKIDLDITLTDKLNGDVDKLNRLVENLVVNAVRHGEGTIAIGVHRVGDSAVLTVRNGGVPIPADLLDKLFDPYARSRSSGGAGLGLYIVKQLARAHGGTVAVSSTAEGTIFTVTLPIALAR